MLQEILERQCGVVTRSQALRSGVTRAAIAAHIAAGRWQRLHRAVYATFSGPIPPECRSWAAVLRAGPGAVLSHESAAALVGLCPPPNMTHVTVSGSRRIAAPEGVRVHYCEHAERKRHPRRSPPQTRVEETVIDLTQSAPSLERAVGWIAAACGQRLTTSGRLRATLDARTRLRWRAELTEALTDVAVGSHSVLERRNLREVERMHALPRGRRQRLRQTTAGRRYDDVHYVEYGVVVELDGRAAHPDHSRSRDRGRDNALIADGELVLRYGWSEVAANPCAVAAQVGTVLRTNGWPGEPQRCAYPNCMIR